MNQDRCTGIWKQLKGKAKVRWGRLTHDPLLVAAGTRDQLAGRKQEQCGAAREQAAQQLKEFLARNRYWYLTNRTGLDTSDCRVSKGDRPRPVVAVGQSRSGRRYVRVASDILLIR